MFTKRASLIVLVLLGIFSTFLYGPPAHASSMDPSGLDAEYGRYWPSTFSIETYSNPSSNFYQTRFEFRLTSNEVMSLRQVDDWLELDINYEGFDFPDSYNGYVIAGHNLPGGQEDNSWGDGTELPGEAKYPVPGITGIQTWSLKANTTYYFELEWNYPANTTPPKVAVEWVPSHWAGDQKDTDLSYVYDWMKEEGSCLPHGNSDPGWCVFPTVRIFLTFPVFGWSTFSSSIQSWSASPTANWAQYMGHIVRWTDGTSWLVDLDGRHWIPTGGDFNCFTGNFGASVYNLTAPQLDAIPDITGDHAECIPPPPGPPPSGGSGSTGGTAPASPFDDIVWRQSPTNFMLNGTSGGGFTVGTPTNGIGNPDWIGTGDFDHDNRQDDIAWHQGGSMYMLLGNNSGGFSLGPTTPSIGAPYWGGVGDFDHDGFRDDIAWRQGSNIFMLYGNGLGGLNIGPTTTGIGTPTWAGVGDIDQDGYLDDLVWRQGTLIYTLYGNGAGKFGIGPNTTGIGEPDWAGVGDFDRDGFEDDLAWHQGRTIFVLNGNGTGKFGILGRTDTIDTPDWAGVGDFNRNGFRDDLAWHQGRTLFTLNDLGTGKFGVYARTDTIDTPSFATVGRFN